VMTASLTGLPGNHRDFDLPVPGVLHADCPQYYRFALDGESEDDFVDRLAANLAALIEREGPDTIAAMIAEPMMGAGGVIIPPDRYFAAIQPILDAHDILLIDDEVICGFGRTGNWFGATTFGMTPKTLSVAKQLTAGYCPLGAVMIPADLYDVIEQQSAKLGNFAHGFTYGGHPLGCALGVKALEIYHKRDILGSVRRLAPQFAARMQRLADHPLVGNTRAVGLVGGIELVADKPTRRPFQPGHGVGGRVVRFGEANGMIIRALGDTLAVCPPMVITAEEIDDLFGRIEHSLDDGEAWVSQGNLRA